MLSCFLDFCWLTISHSYSSVKYGFLLEVKLVLICSWCASVKYCKHGCANKVKFYHEFILLGWNNKVTILKEACKCYVILSSSISKRCLSSSFNWTDNEEVEDGRRICHWLRNRNALLPTGSPNKDFFFFFLIFWQHANVSKAGFPAAN